MLGTKKGDIAVTIYKIQGNRIKDILKATVQILDNKF